MKKYLLILALMILIIPSVSLAAWWNPFSWGIFSPKFQDSPPKQTEVINVPQINNLPATSSNQSTTSTTNSDTNASSTIKTPPVVNIPKKDSKTVKPVVKTPQQIQPTGELCNGTYWNACPAGQKLICPQTGNAYCQLPAQQPRIVPVATTSTITPIATTTVNKGTPYKGHDGNWYYPNAFDTNGKNLQVPAPDITVTATPSSIKYEESATISWVAKGASSCTMNSSPILLAPSGSQTTDHLYTSTTYTLNCIKDGGLISGSVTVDVEPRVLPPRKAPPVDECKGVGACA